MSQDFLTDICNQLDAINLSSEDPEQNWSVFHKKVHSSAATTLGHPSRKHQDWFDENNDEIQRLLYINILKQELDGTRAFQETDKDEMSVVNAHLNELPVKISVCVNEGQDKLPTMYWLPKLHKRPYKARCIANSS